MADQTKGAPHVVRAVQAAMGKPTEQPPVQLKGLAPHVARAVQMAAAGQVAAPPPARLEGWAPHVSQAILATRAPEAAAPRIPTALQPATGSWQRGTAPSSLRSGVVQRLEALSHDEFYSPAMDSPIDLLKKLVAGGEAGRNYMVAVVEVESGDCHCFQYKSGGSGKGTCTEEKFANDLRSLSETIVSIDLYSLKNPCSGTSENPTEGGCTVHVLPEIERTARCQELSFYYLEEAANIEDCKAKLKGSWTLKKI